MAASIGAAVVITAFSACIAPWLDRQNNQNDDDREPKKTLEESNKSASQLQPESLKDIFLNGLRKFTSVCIPSVDMTGSLQHFVNKPFVDIDINIMSQFTHGDSDSSYFTAAESTRTTYESRKLGESEKIPQIVSQSNSAYSDVDTCLQDPRVLLPKIQKPPRAHPPRKSIDSTRLDQASDVNPFKDPIGNEASPKEIQEDRRTETKTKFHSKSSHDRLNKNYLVTNENHPDNPSSTMETSSTTESPKTFEVVATVHHDAASGNPDSMEEPRESYENLKERVSTSFPSDYNNNSTSVKDNYRNNLSCSSSMRKLSRVNYSVHSRNNETSEKSASRNNKSPKNHSSSLVTRIRIVLSRYFSFGSKRRGSRSRDTSATYSSDNSNKTDSTIIYYPGRMSTCITRDLNSENERSKLSFSMGEVTSSTRLIDEDVPELDVPVRDRSASVIRLRMDSKEMEEAVMTMRNTKNKFPTVNNNGRNLLMKNNHRIIDSNQNKSGKSQRILSDGNNSDNSKTTMSDSETEYRTFAETKRGVLKKWRKFFHQSDKNEKWSILSESTYHKTPDRSLKANYNGPTVWCTEI